MSLDRLLMIFFAMACFAELIMMVVMMVKYDRSTSDYRQRIRELEAMLARKHR